MRFTIVFLFLSVFIACQQNEDDPFVIDYDIECMDYVVTDPWDFDKFNIITTKLGGKLIIDNYNRPPLGDTLSFKVFENNRYELIISGDFDHSAVEDSIFIRETGYFELETGNIDDRYYRELFTTFYADDGQIFRDTNLYRCHALILHFNRPLTKDADYLRLFFENFPE